MKPLIVRPLAECDLEAGRQWYEKKRRGLGSDFLLCVDDAFERIQQNPESPAIVYRGVRRVLIRRFPYIIYYRVEFDATVILGVLHGRQRSLLWKSRADQN